MADTTDREYKKKELEQAEQAATGAANQHKDATQKAYTAEEQFAKSVAATKAEMRDAIDMAKDAEAQAAEYDAETQAAAQGAPIGLAEAYALVEQEQKANQMASKAKAQMLKDVTEGTVGIVVDSAGILLDNADAILNGAKDGLGSKAALPYVGSVAGGLAAGMFFQNEGLQSAVINGIEMFTGLRADNPSEADEKFVGGVTTAEEQGAYLAENGNGEPSDPYAAAQDGGTPDADEEKAVQGGNVSVETANEATSISDSEIGDMADVNKVVAGDILQDSGIGKWVDNIAKMFEDHEKSGGGVLGLAEAVVEGGGVAGVAAEVASKVLSPALSKLMAAKDETDRNEASKQQDGPEGPGYPA